MQHGTLGSRATKVRHLVLLLLSLAAFCAYLTRVSISTAATTIQADLRIGNEQMGAVFAAFSFGYFLFQAPGGWLGGRLGTRWVLAAMSIACSVCTFWGGLAQSLGSLWWSRLTLGLAQAGLVPCSSKVLADWVPVDSRGFASALVGSSMSVGAVLASGLTAILLPTLGWHRLFLLYSLPGVAWALAFVAIFRNRPADHPWVNQAERVRIGSLPQTPSGPVSGSPARLLFRAALGSPSLWAICGQSFFRAFGYAFFVTWFPAYLQKAKGVHMVQAGLLTMLPLIGVVAGSVAGGVFVDVVMRRTGSKRLSRSGTAAFALFLCAGATLAAAAARSPLEVVLVIAFGSFFMGVSNPCAWAGTMDISGPYTAVIFAVMNMAGVLGDMASPVSVGYLFSYLERSAGSWSLVLFLFAAINAAGALCWTVLDPNRPALGDAC